MTRLRWRGMYALGVHTLFRRLNRSRALLLMFHGVVPDGRPYYNWCQLAETKFRRKLDYLKKHYSVLPLSEIVEALSKGRPLPPNPAAITFDDGYENNVTVAWPHLRDLGLPATIFLVTGMIGTQRLLWPDEVFLRVWRAQPIELDLRRYHLGIYSLKTLDERDRSYEALMNGLKRMPAERKDQLLQELTRLLPVNQAIPDFSRDFLPMSWEQAQSMASTGLIEFGAHTLNHEILTRVPPEEAHRQVAESCREIRRQLPGMPVSFAYPNGSRADFNPFVQDVLRDEGAICGLTTIEGLNGSDADVYALRRVSVGADTSPYRFPLRSSGAVAWMKSAMASVVGSSERSEETERRNSLRESERESGEPAGAVPALEEQLA